jgi:hypothetical protein
VDHYSCPEVPAVADDFVESHVEVESSDLGAHDVQNGVWWVPTAETGAEASGFVADTDV